MTQQLDPVELRRQLDAAEISDLDTLLARLAESSDHTVEDAAPDEGEVPPAGRPVSAPVVDLILDGERHGPAVFAELAGTDLHATPGVDAAGEPVLYAFTTRAALTAHLSATEVKPSHDEGDIATSNPNSLSPVSTYFEHAGLGGDRLSNNPARAWQDLTRVRRGFLGLSNWNDLISSVDWCRWDIVLYEHINYGGRRLYLPAGRTYKFLFNYGWNDVASATANLGYRR